MDIESIDREDLKKILSLLQEYTQKLKQICDKRMETRYKYIQLYLSIIIATILFTGAYFGSFLYYYSDKQTIDETLTSSIYVFFFVMTMLLIFIVIHLTVIIRARQKDSFNADHLAVIVKRMIKTASQYSEHASKKLSFKFEFDLRLAEAEAALMLYEKAFRDLFKK